MDWFVVESVEGKDSDACLRLANAGIHVWRPFDVIRTSRRQGAGVAYRRGKPLQAIPPRQDRYAPRFGRYFFVEVTLTLSLLTEIEHAPNIRRMLRMAGAEMPVPVPRAQMDYLREFQPKKPKGWKEMLTTGVIVRIMDGPLAGHSGRIEHVDGRGILDIELSVFGRLTRTVIEVGQVERLSAAAKPCPRKTFRGNASVNRIGEAVPILRAG